MATPTAAKPRLLLMSAYRSVSRTLHRLKYIGSVRLGRPATARVETASWAIFDRRIVLDDYSDNVQNAACIFAGAVAAIVVISKLSKSRTCDVFPTVGSTRWPGPYEKDSAKLIREGYAKYKSAPFKIAHGFSWVVVLSNRKHLEEVETAPGNVVERVDSLKLRHTMSTAEFSNDSYMHSTISCLNRNLASLYDDVRDEIVATFDEVLDLKDDEWKSVPVVASIQQIVCRTTNRVFVGLPLCRNSNWVELNLRYTFDVAHGASKLWMIPDFLAPLVIKYRTEIPRNVERGMKLLAPIIQERRRIMKEHGKDWTGKPSDVLSWLLDIEPNDTVRLTTLRLLSINFAAIHSTSISFSHVLFYLVQHPEYIQPLRDEVESIVMKEGWSKASVGKMKKVDSFLKECQRLTGIASATPLRKAAEDLSLSDGTTISKGVFIVGPSREFHYDDLVYPNAHEFNPFRFSDMQNEDGEVSAKNKFTWANSADYLPFGHGKHACPGRFFVGNEFSTMLAHVVMSYDIKLEDSNVRPKEFIVGGTFYPDPTAKVMFRRRGL